MSRLVIALLLAALSPLAAEKKRPNVVFIAADDLRAELGCYGAKHVISPHLDALAKRGLLFEHAYCQQALCNPSRASLMTGLRPDTLRLWNLAPHFRDTMPNVVTLPELFKKNGYATRNIGKIFHNYRTKIEGDPQSWSAPAEMHFGSHAWDWVGDGEKGGKREAVQRLDVEDGAYWDGQITDKAIAAIAALKDNPFFLAVGYWKPHLPFNAPQRYWDLYDREKIPLPENPERPKDAPEIAFHNGKELRGYRGVPKSGTLPDETIRELKHGYYAATSFMDAQVGKVVAALEANGLLDTTIIVFWSDHGFHLGEHTLWCKTSVYELDARVPLIIVDPRKTSASSKRTDAVVELLDLYPTLADLCELTKPAALEGRTLLPLFQDPTAPWQDAAITQHPRPAYYPGKKPETMGYSIRTGRYRYTEWRNLANSTVTARELYDHQLDPRETVNIADREGSRDTIRMSARLLAERLGE